MSKIYTDIEEFEKAQETEFREKVEELAYYQGDNERTTIDGEWTESELRDDIWTEANAILKDWLPKHINRAILDKDLTHEEFIVEDICNRFDIIEVYNRAYDMHRNDKPMLFGIHYFDELVRAEVNKILKNNLVT